MTEKCLGRIRSSYSRFSEKEKKIADYILEKPQLVIHRTINEVADDLNIADATVFRFSKRIGFKGFQAMKIALASEIMTSIQPQEETIQKEKENSLTETMFKTTIKTLEKTLQNIDSNSIKQAIDLIVQANRVEIYGTGNSSLVAMDAFYKLVSVGIKAFAFNEPHYQKMSATKLNKDDVAIIISHSGADKETVNLLKAINETGAKTIGITGAQKSFISVNVDVPLYTTTEETDHLTATFTSKIAQLSLIDALCVNIMNLNKEFTETSLDRANKY
jgi:DNA-binding MurR/RpiR family transcriptional regulator